MILYTTMIGFIKSFTPLIKKLKKYLSEIILLIIALVIAITTLLIYINSQKNTNQEIVTNDQPEQTLSKKVIVDVSGAVKKPSVYEISFGARLKDVIDKANGLSDDADIIFFNRNFNLAQIVTDQEKIYVPSIVEINNGIFVQSQRSLDYLSPGILPNTEVTNNTPADSIININSATIEELDQLPGIGQITANKIITNRPYSIIDELLTKKIINKGVFEKIKNLISI